MPLDLDQTSPEMAQPAEVVGLQSNESDREGAMAKADLYKLANYSQKLFQQLNDEDQLEGWVQAKITKAADYIASVYHYLEYEMKFSEYGKALDDSDVLSESQKVALKTKLLEAKSKIKELKLSQAEKAKDKKVDEGALSGGERACTECGGTGMVYEEPKAIPDHVKGKVEKYKTMVKATKAAHKRMDANNNGIPDDEEMEEGFGDSESKEMKVGDKKKTRTGELEKTATGVKHTNTSYKDEGDEIASNAKSGKGVKSHAKAQTAAEKKEKAPAQKQSPKSAKTWGMKDGEKFDNRDDAPAKPKKEKDVGEGVYEAKKKGDGNLANNAKPYDKVTRGDVIAGRLGKDEKGGKAVKEATDEKCNHTAKGKKCPIHGLKECGMYEAAKYRDPKYKDKLYTVEPLDYTYGPDADDAYYNPRPDDDEGRKRKIGGGEFDHNDPLRKGYGRGGTGSMNTHGKRKGMPSRDHISSLKGSIKSAHGTHVKPNLPEAAKQTMSRAAKGHEKYGKDGMAALAKAGKEGKDLDKIRDKYDKYDESVESAGKKKCPPMSHIKKMCQDGKSVAEICKMHPSCDQKELKQMVADCKKKMDEGKKAATMWNNFKETQMYIAEKAKAVEKKTKEGQDEMADEGNAFGKAVRDAKADGVQKGEKIKVGGNTYPVKESTDLTRMRELTGRLNLNENVIVKNTNEVDQLKALTNLFKG